MRHGQTPTCTSNQLGNWVAGQIKDRRPVFILEPSPQLQSPKIERDVGADVSLSYFLLALASLVRQ